jgi:hypothetical protein
MLVWMAAGWVQQSDLLIIDYLREENRVLREQLGAPMQTASVSESARNTAYCPQPTRVVETDRLST